MTPEPPSAEIIDRSISVLMTGMQKGAGPMNLSDDENGSQMPLRNLDSEADYLNVALEALTRQVEERVAAIRRHRNTLVRFHSLPVELVEDILFASLDGIFITDSHLRSLASVSYAWWQIVKTHPRLWSFVDLGHPDEVPGHLRRSGRLPVFIRWHKHDYPDPPIADVVKLLCAQSHRWKNLNITCHKGENWKEVLMPPLPLLESLVLHFGDGPTTFPKIVGGPRLLTMKLYNILPLLDTYNFAGLKTLRLDSIHTAPPRQLLSILRATSLLECLHFSNINTTTVSAEEMPAVEESITLTMLKSLSMHRCASQTVALLIANVACPELMDLDVAYNGCTREIDVHVILRHFFRLPLWYSILPNIAPSEKITFGLADDTIVDIQGDKFSVSMMVEGPNPASQILIGVPSSPFSRLGPIRIQLDIAGPFPAENSDSVMQPDVLKNLPDVTSIHLACGLLLTNDIMDLLNKPQKSGSNIEWACPRLEHLIVVCRLDAWRQALLVHSVHAMMEARKAAVVDGLVELTVEVMDTDGTKILE